MEDSDMHARSAKTTTGKVIHIALGSAYRDSIEKSLTQQVTLEVNIVSYCHVMTMSTSCCMQPEKVQGGYFGGSHI